jgi:hypothetical protein
LTYTGYAGSGVGNACFLNNSGQDAIKSWAASGSGTTSGNLYYSFLVNVQSCGTTTGNYITGFNSGTTNFDLRVFVKQTTNTSTFDFGVARRTTTAPTVRPI